MCLKFSDLTRVWRHFPGRPWTHTPTCLGCARDPWPWAAAGVSGGALVSLSVEKGLAGTGVPPAAQRVPQKGGHHALLSRRWLFSVALPGVRTQPARVSSPQRGGWGSPRPRPGTRSSAGRQGRAQTGFARGLRSRPQRQTRGLVLGQPSRAWSLCGLM